MWIRVFIAIIVLCISISINAQNSFTSARIFATRDGLPQSFVFGLVQDNEDFVWIGTRIGIVRYDGRNLRPLQYNANDTVKLSSRLIIAMTKDMSGSFWIDHESLAIDRLDPANEKIEHISDRPLFQKNPFRLARQRWTTDELGNLWCAAENGSLYYFNWKENKVNHYTKKTSGVLSDSVWAFLQDPDHSMWMLTRQGLSRFHPGSGQFTHFPLPILASLDNAVPLIKRKNGFLV